LELREAIRFEATEFDGWGGRFAVAARLGVALAAVPGAP
jgi:hypothetical protein